MGLNESDDSSILDSWEESVTIPVIAVKLKKFLQNLFLTQFFSMFDMTAISSSAWQTFAPSLIDVSSFVLCCLHFF